MTIRYLPGKGYDCNLFLVEGKDPILIDTGTGQHTSEILRIITSHIENGRIRTIVLTHRHYDHTGGASAMMRSLGAKVFIHELDAEVVGNGDSWGTMSEMFNKSIDAIEVEPIKAGHVFSSGEHELKVLHTPGHSIGSICLYDESTKELISGDTVFVGGVGRWDLPSGDFDALVKSVRGLRGLDVKSIYPGHGPCGIGNGNEQIAEALSYLGEN
ncbi:MAG TPA: MBL fold metallo-hydrolase [Methanomassiliicoccales archaeon]|nr:MBL fold metallo-hydrolase [Methanomassiliicoccales archaeon]